jgi:hypothetical protein
MSVGLMPIRARIVSGGHASAGTHGVAWNTRQRSRRRIERHRRKQRRRWNRWIDTSNSSVAVSVECAAPMTAGDTPHAVTLHRRATMIVLERELTAIRKLIALERTKKREYSLCARCLRAFASDDPLAPQRNRNSSICLSCCSNSTRRRHHPPAVAQSDEDTFYFSPEIDLQLAPLNRR